MRHIFLLIPCFISVVPHAILFSYLCLYSFTGHQHDGCQKHLARFTSVPPNAAVYLSSPSSHLFTEFGLSALLLLFPVRLMGAVPSGTPPVEWQRWPWRCCRASLLWIYLYFNIYIKENCLCGFSLRNWGLPVGRRPPAPRGLSLSLREQSPHRCAGLSVVDQRSSD